MNWRIGSLSLLAVLAACDPASRRASTLPDDEPAQPTPGKSERRALGAEEAQPPASDPPLPNGPKSSSERTRTPASALAELPPEHRSRQLMKDGEVDVAWLEGADASGRWGVVTSVEAHATRAGVEVLEAGGNAIDAAVATAFALAVTHPSAGNVGGGGFLLLKRGKQVEAIDFREDSPKALTTKAFWAMIGRGGRGGASVGVPGTVAGLHLAHRRHGVLTWARVLAPAIRLAARGFPLGVRQAQTLIWAKAEFSRDPVAKRTFYGKEPHVGVRIRQTALARTLQGIAQRGPSAFYEGPVAEDLVESLGEHGVLSLADLKNYEAKVREPLHFDFYGFRVVTTPAPSAGGVALTQNLIMLQELNVAQTRPESVQRFHLWAEVSRRSQVERQLFVVAPESLSAQENEAARDRTLSPKTWLGPHPVDLERASSSRSLDPRYDQALAELPHTTHFSVTDAEGNLVSCTVTLSGSFGARLMSRQSGVVLNNSVASFSSMGTNTPGPGRRTTSSMAPTLAFLGPDHALVLGSPGGNTIPNTVTQVFTRLALDGLTLKQAVSLPRVHQGFAPQHLQLERKVPVPASLRRQLQSRGHSPEYERYAMGDANVAAWVKGTSAAVYDRREGGLAAAATPSAEAKDPASEVGTSDGPTAGAPPRTLDSD